MKKHILPISLALLAVTAVALPMAAHKNAPVPTIEEQAIKAIDSTFDGDPISYTKSEDAVVELSKLKPVTRDGADELRIPEKVILHYINDDGDCLSRRFYTWVTGYDGIERKADDYKPDSMSITLDFEVIEEYANMPSLFFIIKKAGTWSGQSEDVELKYENFQKDDDDNWLIKDVGGKLTLELWLIPGEGSSIEFCISEDETKIPKIATAKFTDWKTIHCVSSDPTKVPKEVYVYAFDRTYLNSSESNRKSTKDFYLFKEYKEGGKDGKITTSEFDIVFNYTAKINIQYLIESIYPGGEGKPNRKIFASFEYLYKTSAFAQYYTYSGNDLGVTYSKEKTTFKVWSPISANMVLNLYGKGVPTTLDPLDGTDTATPCNMFYTGNGVWELTVVGDCAGKYYTYKVTNPGGTAVETMDPYAHACGMNGVRGYVYDKDGADANPEGWSAVPSKWDGVTGYDIKSPNELSIYEAHIRDLTMDSSWTGSEKPGTYAAFAEKGTSYNENFKGTNYTVSTGFDHIEELGVSAVQLLPVFDHDDDERADKMKFNWGYNPLNYNCIEGGYSTYPNKPLNRIVEFKQLIKNFAENKNHTRIIMDVVYNHVSSASSSCFTKLMPKYYFRYDAEWNYTDGSGCSNEVKTEAPMMSKYIVDSLVWWASEYKIKGFRFDLMGLIDTGTIAAARKALNNVDPDIYIYGEGWTSVAGYNGDPGTEGSSSANVYSMLYPDVAGGYVGAFNDAGRDAIRGGNDHGYGTNNSYPSWGYVAQGRGDGQGKIGDIYDMFRGYHTGKGGNPNQCINYVSCHDNYTVWDQFRYTLATKGYENRTSPLYDNSGRPINGGEPAISDLVSASIAAHGLVMNSNGVAFIQGGEEIYRTKTISKEKNDAEGIKATPDYDDIVEIDPLTGKISNESYCRPFPDFETYVDPEERVVDALSTGEVRMYGTNEFVSHNSYKLPDSVNSFKWDRKIHIGDTLTYKENATWSKMVNKRKELTKFGYGAPEMDQFHIWNNDDQTDYYQGAFGMWNPGGICVAVSARGSVSWLKVGNVTPLYASTAHEVPYDDDYNLKKNTWNIASEWLAAGSFTLIAW